jgi:protein O-GlcNAc transferase
MAESQSSAPASSSPLQAAVELHQGGQVAKAASAYRRILEAEPNHPQALHLLGVTFIQAARPGQGVELIERAIALLPNVAIFHLNLASAYQALRRIDDAIGEAEKAIALDSTVAAGGYQIAGLAFLDGGAFEDAAYCFEKSIEADATSAEAHLMLAIAVDRLGRVQEGVAAYNKALDIAQQRVARNPSDGAAHRLLGRIYQQAGKIEEAVGEYRAATRLSPEDPTLFYSLGQTLQQEGKRDEALTCFQLALRMNPDFADAHIAVGHILDRQQRPAEAIVSFKTALALSPLYAEAHGALSAALTHCGQIDEAIESGRKAVSLNPGSPGVHSSLLLTMHYSPRFTPQELFEEHREWGRRHADALAASITPHTNQRDPEKIIRVGFLSGDFKAHPVAKFILPVLENHDRSKFVFACYSDTEVSDDLSAKMKSASGAWRRVVSWSDQRLADQIREDQVDILVDLMSHTGLSRLLTMARKPAPIQVTQFGYPGTTGMLTVDYRMTDALADPPGQTEAFSTEKLARLPRVAWCYRAYEGEPRIEDRKTTDPVTFGSVNNIAKLSADTLTTWGKLLRAVSDARLVVLATSREIDRTRDLLVNHGIDPTRLTILPRAPVAKYMDLFNLFDVALDPFPYNGGVTSCDAMWMGVPIISLAGSTYVSRQGVSLLTNVGLPDLIARDADDYIAVAAKLAADRERLAHLRLHLREMMRTSPICDYAGYTRELEGFYRTAWRKYCQSPGT